MTFLNNLLLSFISTICFGIIFNLPKNLLFWSGWIGAFGWVSYWITNNFTNNYGISNFVGALVIGVLCAFAARKLKVPVIVLNIPAIVPLVPGGAAYMTVRRMVEGNTTEFFKYFGDVIMALGAIVVGFMVVKLLELELGFSKIRRKSYD